MWLSINKDNKGKKATVIPLPLPIPLSPLLMMPKRAKVKGSAVEKTKTTERNTSKSQNDKSKVVQRSKAIFSTEKIQRKWTFMHSQLCNVKAIVKWSWLMQKECEICF